MKTTFFFYLTLLVGFVLLNNEAFSQETKDQKKALDAFITATTKSVEKSEPVPGAEITVEQVPGPIVVKKCVTDKNGEFSVSIEEIELAYKKIERTGSSKIASSSNEINLQITVKPKDPTKYSTLTNTVIMKVKKSDGPKFVFVITWQKSTTKTNKGAFAINPKAQS